MIFFLKNKILIKIIHFFNYQFTLHSLHVLTLLPVYKLNCFSLKEVGGKVNALRMIQNI